MWGGSVIWFKNLKISKKLILCFTLVALFVAVVGLNGILDMKKIDINAISIYEDNMQTLSNLQKIDTNTLYIRLAVINLVEGKDSSKCQDTIKQMQEYRNQNDDMIKRFKSSALVDGQKDLLNTFDEDLKEYRASCDEIIKLVSQGNYEQAMSLSKDSDAVRNKLTTSLDKLIDIEKKQAENKNTENQLIYKNHTKFSKTS